MSRIEMTKGATTIRGRSRRRIAMAIALAVLATTGLASANHLKRKDRAVIASLARSAYADPYETLLVDDCGCLEPTCEGGFMLSCGGEIDPLYAGFLNTVRRTSRETCLVCGCAVLGTLRATPVCLGD